MYSAKFEATVYAIIKIMVTYDINFMLDSKQGTPPRMVIHYHVLKQAPPDDKRQSIRVKKRIRMDDISDHEINIQGSIYNYNQVSIKMLEMII